MLVVVTACGVGDGETMGSLLGAGVVVSDFHWSWEDPFSLWAKPEFEPIVAN